MAQRIERQGRHAGPSTHPAESPVDVLPGSAPQVRVENTHPSVLKALALGFAAGLLLFVGWGIVGALRGWGMPGAPPRRGGGGLARRHDAPPPFAVALGAGALGVLALFVRPGA